MSPSLVMCTGMVTIISHVLTVSRHLHMLPPLLGKQPCLNFTVTFLFNPVAGFLELPVKNFAILLMVTIAFPEKKNTNAINDSVSIFVCREEKRAWYHLLPITHKICVCTLCYWLFTFQKSNVLFFSNMIIIFPRK